MSKADVGFAPIPYTRLRVKYALLSVYGLVASIVGVTTVGIVGGTLWETVWPFLISVTGLAAVVGVSRSKTSGKSGMEFATTLALLALLNSYTVAIVVRTFSDGDLARLTVALLPIIISVTPFGRMLDIGRGLGKK